MGNKKYNNQKIIKIYNLSLIHSKHTQQHLQKDGKKENVQKEKQKE